MKNLFVRLSIPFTLLTAGAYGHGTALPHSHPHGATTTWANLLIAGGIVVATSLAALAVIKWNARQRPVHQRVK